MTYEEILAQPGQSVVLFYGAACAPCELLKPRLRSICKTLNVPLHEINSANELPTLRALGVRQVPTVFVVERSNASLAFSGALDAETIRERLARHDIIYRGNDTEMKV